jgi:hypothetical protein
MANFSDKVKKDMITAMRSASIPPQLIYAYEHTGFLLVEETYKKLSPEDKAEYDGAIEEYYAKKKKKLR